MAKRRKDSEFDHQLFMTVVSVPEEKRCSKGRFIVKNRNKTQVIPLIEVLSKCI